MEVGLAVGGVFISAFLQVALDHIASNRQFIKFFQGKKSIKFDEVTLDKLEITLGSIYVVLEDAENKQANSPAVRSWIDKLKDAVNQADDLLDEINTECLRLKIDYEFKSKANKGYKKLSLKSDFVEKLMPDLKKITDRLEYFVYQIHVLGLRKFDSKEKCPYRAPSSSVVDKSQIFGRDEEREKLVQMVFSDEGAASAVSVIPITGMGGVGKTTLAQQVYNDCKVKDHFPIRAWVCVSEEYDALRVTKALLLEINSGVVDDKDDLNRLQVKLRDSLADKCFLIVMDDIWNENYNDWHSLKNPLNHGSRGSKIIVTTRNEKVALMMRNEPFHHMQPILEDQSWSLFKSHAFDNGECTSLEEFEAIGREIVKKCKGLPLAIKTIAGALRPKREIGEWQDILSSEIWTTGTDILPSLSLSYKHLPSHLQCCFAFCSIFPKDIPFDKDHVVLLWMANDLVQPSTHKCLKEIGRDYFEDIRSRSLFEKVNYAKRIWRQSGFEIVNETMYLMHDLVNDFAQHVSGNFCIRLQDYQDRSIFQGVQRDIDLPQEVLHFSYLQANQDTSRKFVTLSEVHSLRTLLAIGVTENPCKLTTLFFSDILPRFRRIRALNLSPYYIELIPNSIGDLKQLRFINLASASIRVLPNAITKCLNLQTLILANCRSLEKLPEDMRLLINLQHLDVRGVGTDYDNGSSDGNTMIDRMASWLSILTYNQNLSIVVDKIHGRILDNLCKFQLCQFLDITGLENAVNVEIAKRAELKRKNCVEYLTLAWSGIAECSEDELNLFAELRPHTNTKGLSIKGYRGTRFSDWLGDSAFSNMESLHLQDCKNCFFLPPLGQLTALKKLQISGMDAIVVVGEEFYGNDFTSKPFQALEELRISRMAEWAIWNTLPDNVEFPSLVLFSITDCPKLVGDFPFDVTSLKKFTFGGCPGLVTKHLIVEKGKNFEFPTGNYPCLESLRIESCGNSVEAIPLISFSKLRDVSIQNWENPKLFKCPNGSHQTITALQSLNISYCNNILSFPDGGLPAPNLKSFWISSCKKLKSLPEQMNTLLPLLQVMDIYDCPEIKCFPEGGLPSSLENLHINSCDEIEGFPEGGLPSSLKSLEIDHCKKLMIWRRNWGLQRLPSLITLTVGGFDGKLFPEEGLLPSSLHKLGIWECNNLKALSQKSLQHLTSLQSLSIRKCPKLRYLPEDMFSSTLSTLRIYDCPKLKVLKGRGKGKDWHKVSHIPVIIIEDELIS